MNSTHDIIAIAARHGLLLNGKIQFNEMGLDFRVGFASDSEGRSWVLRLPRRDGLQPVIEREARILDFVRSRLPVQVPEWQICEPDLVAYPLLTDPMALTFDSDTYEVSWNINQDSSLYITSLAKVLVALHAAPSDAAAAAGIPVHTPEQVRKQLHHDMQVVKREIGISPSLEDRCLRWLDNDTLWPDYSVLVHGDLYAGHVTAASNGQITGVIDWTEAVVSDPSIDFSGHLSAFSHESLEQLIAAYEHAGGRVWPGMTEHIAERHAIASPIRYGLFALTPGNGEHIAAVKSQLGVSFSYDSKVKPS
ncbi:macrolide 2'-phosphotransferase [Spirochaeta africana]|uniref:Putative aminoglycoside phosphotransferase n=1 Tax=Spirochaeta africana (strain ATCC 700263 / DSM 8902 / Z-7692) TaxID=889378 RepID=H9UG51_SPIAZ|nr:macrolide 2'-phosphotransferase [Spirochaeta africana]AFG36494.1 putative aminoglycoside phosphotransferase [Spirochaeta africana DSM 8902]